MYDEYESEIQFIGSAKATQAQVQEASDASGIRVAHMPDVRYEGYTLIYALKTQEHKPFWDALDAVRERDAQADS